MLKDVLSVELKEGYRLHLGFEDGVEGEVDISDLLSFTGIFSGLRDRKEFARVYVDPETGTISWPNGADIDPVVLYSRVTGKDISELLSLKPEAVS